MKQFLVLMLFMLLSVAAQSQHSDGDTYKLEPVIGLRTSTNDIPVSKEIAGYTAFMGVQHERYFKKSFIKSNVNIGISPTRVSADVNGPGSMTATASVQYGRHTLINCPISVGVQGRLMGYTSNVPMRVSGEFIVSMDVGLVTVSVFSGKDTAIGKNDVTYSGGVGIQLRL